MNSLFVTFLANSLVALAATVELRVHRAHEEAFEAYQQRYGRSYTKGTAEYSHRLALYSQRAAEAEEHNAKANRLWTAAAGPLADRTEVELAELRGWFGSAKTGGQGRPNLRRGMFLAQVDKAELPEDFGNWTSLKVFEEGRDQGGCGSCWAVAAASVLTAHAEIYETPQRSFSPQELVECVPNPKKCGGSGGCDGATVELAMDYVITHGLRTEDEEPYSARDADCPNKESILQLQDDGSVRDVAAEGVHTSQNENAAGLALMGSWEVLPKNKYEPLMRAVVERGPVAISVDATSWSLYSSGIFDGCSKDAVINHAVVLVGYGKDQERDTMYWTVENSWGHEWGEGGMIRLLRHKNEEEQCGIDNQPQDGTGCEGGPASVEVCGSCGILYDSVVPHFKKKP